MQRLLLAIVALTIPVAASAHVGVRPRESKLGAEERYTVRVPTEGAVTTTSVMLEIPDGVTVLEVIPTDGATFETQKKGDRIVAISWKKDIKPKEAGEFLFRARNPESGTEILWRAHQYFADGTMTAWTEPAGGRRPGPVTKLVMNPSTATSQGTGAMAASAVEFQNLQFSHSDTKGTGVRHRTSKEVLYRNDARLNKSVEEAAAQRGEE